MQRTMTVIRTDISTAAIIPKASHHDRCHRCGGFMVQEKVFEIGSFDWHCVNCGERIDPLILAHRRAHRSSKDEACKEAESFCAGKGNARLQ